MSSEKEISGDVFAARLNSGQFCLAKQTEDGFVSLRGAVLPDDMIVETLSLNDAFAHHDDEVQSVPPKHIDQPSQTALMDSFSDGAQKMRDGVADIAVQMFMRGDDNAVIIRDALNSVGEIKPPRTRRRKKQPESL